MKFTLALLSVLFIPLVARAYPVAPPILLDDLTKEADVILKVTAIASEKVEDESFKSYPHWAVFSTRLKVISVLKGKVTDKEVDFHHFDEDPTGNQAYMFAPQHYHFKAQESYIVFAKSTKAAGVLRMIWEYHRGREDQGQVWAADDKALTADADVKTAVWNELTQMCASDQPVRVQYAVAMLNSMSNTADRFDGTNDFSRATVLAVLAPLIAHKDPTVCAAAIEAIASRSPYLRDDLAAGWLATVGKGTLIARGQSKYPGNWDNPDGRANMAQLIKVADQGATVPLRARAIRALGLVKDKSLLEPLRKWSGDDAAEVRTAAVLLWSDFPGDERNAQLTRMAADPDLSVRRAVATAVGFSQSPQLLSVLNKFLTDGDESLRSAAAASLISFDPKESGDLLKAFRDNPDYHATFINALALSDPTPWLDDLARIVVGNIEPKLQFVSQMPVYTSWQILKEEMDRHTSAELASGKFDKFLDALETPPNIGSGPYQAMYQLYKDTGLKERAVRFRAEAKKRVTGYDIDYYFKLIDGSK